jgi:hypothetical protein
MATQSNTVGCGEDLKNSKPERNNSSGNKSGAATVANFATSSSFTRRATGPRTPRGKERSKFNARKHGLFSKAVLLQDESHAEYDALLNGLMESRQPQGKLEIVLVENLATLLWRKRRLLQVETAESGKAQFLNCDLALQNEVDELEYAQLKGAPDAKPEHSNPILLIRNAIEILDIQRKCFLAGDSESVTVEAIRRTLKSIYGYQDGGPAPYGWRQMSLKLAKLISSAEQGKENSEDPHDVKQFIVDAIWKEIMRLAKLHDDAAKIEALRREHNLAGARIPSQEVSDRLIRYEAHLSREFDRTLAQLERMQRMRLGQPVLPKLEVQHSMS